MGHESIESINAARTESARRARPPPAYTVRTYMRGRHPTTRSTAQSHADTGGAVNMKTEDRRSMTMNRRQDHTNRPDAESGERNVRAPARSARAAGSPGPPVHSALASTLVCRTCRGVPTAPSLVEGAVPGPALKRTLKLKTSPHLSHHRVGSRPHTDLRTDHRTQAALNRPNTVKRCHANRVATNCTRHPRS